MHQCHQGDERHQVEVELGGCCLVVEELDDHLAQCGQLVRSAQQVQPLLLELAVQQVLLVQSAQQARVQCVQLAQAT